MEQRNPERALAPAAPYLAGLAVIYSTLSVLVWLAGELAGWLWTRHWPPGDGTDALAALAYLSRDPSHPTLAWPAAARQDLAPAPFFYAAVVVLFAAHPTGRPAADGISGTAPALGGPQPAAGGRAHVKPLRLAGAGILGLVHLPDYRARVSQAR